MSLWSESDPRLTLTKPCQSLKVFPTISCSSCATCVMFSLIFQYFSSKLMKINSLVMMSYPSERSSACLSVDWWMIFLKSFQKQNGLKKKVFNFILNMNQFWTISLEFQTTNHACGKGRGCRCQCEGDCHLLATEYRL